MKQEFQQSLKPKAMLKCIFPVPLYVAKRGLIVEEEKEEKEINDIIEEENSKTAQDLQVQSVNSHIFDTKLYNLKEFCEQHIKMYVKEIINPKEELDFYITQSWLNLTRPGGSHRMHVHGNSIISGVYYIATVEDDGILFYDPNMKVKRFLDFAKKSDPFPCQSFEKVNTGDLIIFPSWLDHGVQPNPKATTNRISLSFNTFARGTFGNHLSLDELTL